MGAMPCPFPRKRAPNVPPWQNVPNFVVNRRVIFEITCQATDLSLKQTQRAWAKGLCLFQSVRLGQPRNSVFPKCQAWAAKELCLPRAKPGCSVFPECQTWAAKEPWLSRASNCNQGALSFQNAKPPCRQARHCWWPLKPMGLWLLLKLDVVRLRGEPLATADWTSRMPVAAFAHFSFFNGNLVVPDSGCKITGGKKSWKVDEHIRLQFLLVAM